MDSKSELGNNKKITKRADLADHDADDNQPFINFEIIDLIMMSIVILLLVSTNALSTHLPKDTKDMLATTWMSISINVAFIFFTVVWSKGKDNISPFTSVLLSILLFMVFLIVTRLPKYFFLAVLLLLAAYFIIHHMQVYRQSILNDSTQTPQNLLESIHFAISHKIHDQMMLGIFYTTAAVIVVGFIMQFLKEKKSIPDGGLFATLKKMFIDAK